MIDEHQVDTVLYTDGSCKGGSEDGGSAVVITTGTASNPVVLEVIIIIIIKSIHCHEKDLTHSWPLFVGKNMT